MGGSAAASLNGRLDEIAIYRTALSADAIKARCNGIVPKPAVTTVPSIKLSDLPRDLVRVEILEHGVSETDATATDWASDDSDKSKITAGAAAS